jgi:hypothetical protein
MDVFEIMMNNAMTNRMNLVMRCVLYIANSLDHKYQNGFLIHL